MATAITAAGVLIMGSNHTSVASASPTSTAPTVNMQFNARVRDVPLTLSAGNARQTIVRGTTGSMFFRVTNPTDHPVETVAALKVVPARATGAFVRLQCFCYEKQIIPPRSTQFFPVRFYVDPRFQEENMEVNFTFFPAAGFDANRHH